MNRKRPHQNGEPVEEPAFAELLRKVAHAPSIDPKSMSERNAAVAAQETLAGKHLAHFSVLERIGEGGMGVVYKAVDDKLKRTVALKVLPPRHAADRERVARLWREAQSAAAVNHPRIASIYELGESQGLTFIAMEYVAGQSLRAYAKRRPLLIGEAVHVARQIAEGLARAHDAGVVHRDLKPDNVMIGPDRAVKLLDFGLATLTSTPPSVSRPGAIPLGSEYSSAPTMALGDDGSRAPTRPGGSAIPQSVALVSGPMTNDSLVLGTPDYMSPEQAERGTKADARSDVYSFGVLLFEMLTGTPPSPGGDARAHLLYFLEGPGQEIDASVVQPIERLVLKCIDRDPNNRFPNGAAVLAALSAVPVNTGLDLPRVPFWVHTETRQRFYMFLVAVVVLIAGGAAAAHYINRYLTLEELKRAAAINIAEQAAQRPEEHRLTANPPENPLLDAALSPNGEYLAYVDQRGVHLRTINPPSTRSLKLPDKSVLPQSVTWASTLNELYVAARSPVDDKTVLYALPLEGPARFLGLSQVRRPVISPDGSQVAFFCAEGLCVAPPSFEKPRVLLEKDPEDELSELHWSPDGKRLLFVHIYRLDKGGKAYLETMDPLTGYHQLIHENPGLLHSDDRGNVTWAADGRILFALRDLGPSEGGFTLWAIALDPISGMPRFHPRLLNSWVGPSPGMLSVANGNVAYARAERQTDIYLLDLEGSGRASGAPRRLTMSDRNELPSSWAPNGKTILYVSDRDGSYDLFADDVTTGETQKLLEDKSSQTWPTFTRRGTDILYWDHQYPDDLDPTSAKLMRARLPGGEPSGLFLERHRSTCNSAILPPQRVYLRCPLKDGRCILGEADGSQIQFSVIDGRGRPHTLTNVDNPGTQFHGWDVSPDGGRIALPGASGQIRLLDLQKRKAVDQFVDKRCELNGVSFSASGHGLYSTAVCAGEEKPYKVFFSEGQRPPVVLWESASMSFFTPLASPDGKHLAIGAGPFDDDVWLVTGL